VSTFMFPAELQGRIYTITHNDMAVDGLPLILCSFQWQRFPARWIQSDFRVDDQETDSAVKTMLIVTKN